MQLYKNNQDGFTLVELAIVLMIIGLLIGGILKGQELINNVRVTTMIRQLQSYPAAVLTFQDSYGMLPGDMTNPGTRLPNCSGDCATAGNGDALLAADLSESMTFWLHLNAANLITGVRTSGTTINTVSPETPLGGIYLASPGFISLSTPSYFMRRYDGGNAAIATTGQAARMDRKLDDGIPTSGIFRGLNSGRSAPFCAPPGVIYDESHTSVVCYMQYEG